MTAADEVAVVVNCVLPATPDVVYDEWLDPDSLRDWMCPRPARAVNVEVDPRVGGRLRIDIEESGVEFFVAGRFLVLDRPHRLVFSWTCSTWPEPSLDTTVTVTLDAIGEDETRMTIRHEALPENLRPDHRNGWGLIAQQLEQKLRRP
jgi:uncharacterized protein YndB with AHSA1/START domain